jgi:hypothetical protein
MIGKALILATLSVWVFSGADQLQAKRTFTVLIAIGALRFLYKWIRHRQTWSKYVALFIWAQAADL